MTKYNFKRAPNGWIYPLSKKGIKNFTKEVDGNFTNVEFEGTTKPYEFLQDISCWIGILKSKRINEEWYFSLEISCLKKEYILPWKDEIQELMINDMKQWINHKINLLPTAPEKPASLYLKYEIINGNCGSSSWEVD